MTGNGETPSLAEALRGEQVVIDLKSPYVCIGTLVGGDGAYLELRDADLHDFRDSPVTREVYAFDAARIGVRRNRKRVLVRTDEVVALSRLADLVES